MSSHAVYGLPPDDLAAVPEGAAQVSPLVPGSARLEDLPPGGLEGATVLAPPGAVERRYALALALRALAPGGRLVALAPKDRGGARLARELAAFGCAVTDAPRRHHRICTAARPDAPTGLDEAIAAGAPRRVEAIAAWTQPGVFAWDRVDPGTALLVAHLPRLKGRGADLGCGLGFIARAALLSEAVTELTLVDVDRRAVEAARANVVDPRARVVWADVRAPEAVPAGIDFVAMNPPFHDGGAQDQLLGAAFIARAADALRVGGTLRLVANLHLPYEAPLRERFRAVAELARGDGYKVIEARK